MKAFYPLIVILLFGVQSLPAQNDTLVGVLRDAKEKVVKNYPVTLGRQNPQKAKTDRYGVFTIPNANLKDTLYVLIKKEKKEVAVPVNGYNFLSVTLREGTFKADHRLEPDIYLQQILARERNKMISMDVLNRDEIVRSRCLDVRCLLQRLNGVTVRNNGVSIRGGVTSINSGTNALIVIDGIPSEETSLLFSLPMQTIQEISVMKDGTLYGARGANGVIIVKTQ